MSIRFFSIVFLLSILGQLVCVNDANAQSKPLAPTLEVISVDPLTGSPALTWTKPKYNPLNPDPTGYLIYRRFTDALGNNDLYAIGSVDSNTFTFSDAGFNAGEARVSYTVASDGPTEPSPMSAEHYTMFLTAHFDSCRNGLRLDWTPYVGWGNQIEYHKIFIGKNLDVNSYTEVKSISGTINSFFVDTIGSEAVQVNQNYYIFIEAKKAVQNTNFITRSNLASVFTKISLPPSYMYIDSIIAKDTRTELHFSIDNITEYRNFRITRWEQVDSVRSIFSARTLFRFTDPSIQFFADTTDSWAARSRKFFFKVDAFDGCERLTRQTNLSNSMVLRIFTRGMKANLSWDRLYSSAGNPVQYKIYRMAFAPEPLARELIFDERNPRDTVFVDDLSAFSGLGYMPQFCYYIEAYEEVGIPGKQRLSRSRTICTEVTPEVIIPNALDPLSQIIYMGVPRNVFAPYISFEASYKMIIYNRWGGLVFEGYNTGWNGRLPDGSLAKEGTYLYRIEVYSESKRTISKTGTVSVIYGPI